MDIPVQEAEVLIGGNTDFTEKHFSIAQTRHTFQILSSGLYSNKEKAIVRELACNAWDSHIEAGTKDTPFVICLPNRVEPFFKIRDYGTGMSHDDVMDIYTKYFESTKKQTNSQIGCFGLGSKSPFAYTKNFAVTSFFNGKKLTYNMIISAEGLPKVIHVSTEDTDEASGVEVSFAVKGIDQGDFVRAARSVLRPFGTLPTVKGSRGFEVAEEPAVLVAKDNWKVYKTSNAVAGLPQQCAVMGNVEYPLVTQSGFSPNARMVLRLPISIRFPIGTFEVTPSRETISWTDFSQKNVNQVLEDIYESIVVHVNGSISGSKTLWEARLSTMKLMHRSPLSKLQIKPTWHGRTVSVTTRVPPTISVTELSAVKKQSHGMSTTACKASKADSITPADTVFFLDDIKSSKGRVGSYVRGLDVGKSVYLISPHTNKAYKEFLHAVGISSKSVRLASSIPKPVRVYSGGGTTGQRSRLAGTKARVFTLNKRFHYSRAEDNWTEQEVDLSTGGIYVQIHRYKVVTFPGGSTDAPASPSHLREAIAFVEKVTGQDHEIIGVKTAGLSKFEKASNWVDLASFIRSAVLDMWDSDKDLRTAYYLMDDSNERANSSALTLAALDGVSVLHKALVKDGYDKKVPNSPIFKFQALSSRITAKKSKYQPIEDVRSWWDDKFSLVSLYSNQNSPDFRGALYKSYPMLKIAERGASWNDEGLWDKTSKHTHLIEYIKFIDGLRAQGTKV